MNKKVLLIVWLLGVISFLPGATANQDHHEFLAGLWR